MNRTEYMIRQHEFQPRGLQLPQTKLTPLEVNAIRSAARQRENLRKYINENLSNAALAKIYGVHPRTVEKILSGETWAHTL